MRSSILLISSFLTATACALPFLNTVQDPSASSKKSVRLEVRHQPVSRSQRLAKRGVSCHETNLADFEDARYITTINIAGQELSVALQTGGADTYVYSQLPDDYVHYNRPLPPLFDNSTAVGLTDLNEYYLVQINSTASIQGDIQIADISLVGTDLKATQMPFVNVYQSFQGSGASGVLGLGFPLNSQVFDTITYDLPNKTGTNLKVSQTKKYFPFVPLLFEQGEISKSMFSLELGHIGASASPNDQADFNYTRPGGTLTIGDFPEGYEESQFTWSSVPLVTLDSRYTPYGYPSPTGIYWTTALEAIYFNGARIPDTKLQPNVSADGGKLYSDFEVGDPGIYLPKDIMSHITDAWANNPENKTLKCDARFDLAVQISGRNFTMNKSDILVPSWQALDQYAYGGFTSEDCQFQAQPGPVQPGTLAGSSVTYHLGDPFLRSVVMVYDYGSIENAEKQPPRIGFLSKL